MSEQGGLHLPKLLVMRAQVAQSVEHVLGKDEVGGSSPLLGFRLKWPLMKLLRRLNPKLLAR